MLLVEKAGERNLRPADRRRAQARSVSSSPFLAWLQSELAEPTGSTPPSVTHGWRYTQLSPLWVTLAGTVARYGVCNPRTDPLPTWDDSGFLCGNCNPDTKLPNQAVFTKRKVLTKQLFASHLCFNK